MKYTILEKKENEDFASILINDGKFLGVIYQYGQVTPTIDDTKDECLLSFEYDIIQGSDIYTPEDLKCEPLGSELGDVVGDILLDILESSLEESQAESHEFLPDGTGTV